VTDGLRSITVRTPELDLGANVPVLWYDGRPGVTHFTNALGALFPEGERFFVRSVRALADRVTDERLREDVKRFVSQEVNHGAFHDRYNALLAEQGINLDFFFRSYRRVCRTPVMRWARPLCLSITASAEHFTAVAARLTFRQNSLERAHPEMKKLYEWHALEELEHKAVAFDVLAAASGSYLLRITGFLLCLLFGPLFIAVPLFFILARAGLLFSPRVYTDLLSWGFLRERVLLRFMAGLPCYFRPGFHPEQEDDAPLFRTLPTSLAAP
jgi:uncharacterized protein